MLFGWGVWCLGYHVLVFSSRTVHALLVMLAFVSSLTLRSAFSYRTVFRGDEVVFQDPDGAFHARTIQNLVQNYPHRTGLDPYSGFPRGQNVDTGPFPDYVMGTAAWIAGLGAPSRHLTDTIAAWFPALLGALMVVPVYFLGRELFPPAAGLIASGLVAILPGNFLWVSRLGNPDHHVSEVFLSTVLLLLLVKALKGNAAWRLVVPAGAVAGCYLMTQSAGAYLLLALVIWATVQVFVNRLHGQESGEIWRVSVMPLFIGWVMLLVSGPTLWSPLATGVLVGGMVMISGVVGLSKAVRSQAVFVGVLTGGVAAGAAGIGYWQPQLVESAISSVAGRLVGNAQTVGELRPLLTADGSFSLVPAWAEFSTCWFLAPVAMVIVGWRGLRANLPAQLLFAIWSAYLMAASFQVIRNCYYLAVPMALLSGFACAELVRLDRRYERMIAGLLAGAALVGPNLLLAYPMASADTGPREEWRGALAFLRKETPEPFGDEGAYDGYFPRRAEEAVFAYPPTAYGVMNWWDFGHWITAYGRRIPVANGMQTGATEAAQYFTTTDPARGAALLRRMGARYVIADSSIPLGGPRVLQPGSGSFLAMLTWARVKEETYWEEFLGGPAGSEGIAFPVFYPAYYESMLARLYLFDGREQTPAGSTWVIRYAEEMVRGRKRKRLVQSQRFPSYEEAQRYVREHPAPRQVMAGLNPLASCVPIRRMEGYRLVYPSKPVPAPDGEPLQAVKIFEFVR